jgi:predicted ATPase
VSGRALAGVGVAWQVGVMSRPPLTIEVQNLKALKSFKWTPTGVCALVGANGTGKSTALRAVDLVRLGVEDGMPGLLRPLGSGPFRHMDADVKAPVQITLSVPGADWTVGIERTDRPMEIGHEGGSVVRRAARNVHPTAYEISSHGGSSVVMLLVNEGDFALRSIRSRSETPLLAALAEVVQRSRVFARPNLDFLRNNGSADGTYTVLDTPAEDLFTVLKNWKLNSDYEGRLMFVIESMRELFPGFRNFDFPQAGQRTSALSLGSKEKLRPTDWSDGFFCCLSMLTGIASVEGGIVAIDEPENSLHPELIKRVIELMREWSRTRETTILLATHSPVLLDQFREDPEQVFVMQPGRDQLPVALDQLKKREWLEHFSLGDLYSHLEVGAREA